MLYRLLRLYDSIETKETIISQLFGEHVEEVVKKETFMAANEEFRVLRLAYSTKLHDTKSI